MFIQKIKIIFSILLCLLTGGNFFQGTANLFRAGSADMIGNDHIKSFAAEYTELVPYADTDEDRVSWMQGMVTGNGGTGALCEWAMKKYEENDKHRHISHLYAAWPAFETQENAALAAACDQAIENRNLENEGEDDTASHGWVHKALVAARLKNPGSAYHSLYMLMADDIYYTSLMTDHYTHGGWGVFCTDTSIGTVGVLDEMLLYSNTGVIEALPALPAEWSEGSITGGRKSCGIRSTDGCAPRSNRKKPPTASSQIPPFRTKTRVSA